MFRHYATTMLHLTIRALNRSTVTRFIPSRAKPQLKHLHPQFSTAVTHCLLVASHLCSQSSTLPFVPFRTCAITRRRLYASCVFPERIDFKLAVLVYKCHRRNLPSNFMVWVTRRVNSGCALYWQRISSYSSPLCNHQWPHCPSHSRASMEPSRDVPEPDSELRSSRILQYPVTSGMPGFTTSGSAKIRQIPEIRIRLFCRILGRI